MRFRSLGAPVSIDLSANQPKAAYLKNLDATVHRDVIDRPAHLDATNGGRATLHGFRLCVPGKESPQEMIIEELEERSIPFTDVALRPV